MPRAPALQIGLTEQPTRMAQAVGGLWATIQLCWHKVCANFVAWHSFFGSQCFVPAYGCLWLAAHSPSSPRKIVVTVHRGQRDAGDCTPQAARTAGIALAEVACSLPGAAKLAAAAAARVLACVLQLARVQYGEGLASHLDAPPL